MDSFLQGVERRAYRMAEFATGHREDALDIVQDAMMGLVRSYAARPAEEWGALFYRILQSRIRDWQRRNIVRSRLRSWLGLARGDDADPPGDPMDTLPDPRADGPVAALSRQAAMAQLEVALRRLPLRQQQAFLLRAWEGLDVAATADAMGCSQGSVKTHYSRALNTLRGHLEAYR